MNNQKVTRKAKIEITGMTCASCAGHVTKELEKIGSKNVSVNPVAGKAFLEVEDSVTEKQLQDAVKEAGYNPVSVEFEEAKISSNHSHANHSMKTKEHDSSKGEEHDHSQMPIKETRNPWKRKLLGVWLLTIPLLILMYLPGILGIELISMNLMQIAMLVFSFPIIFIFGFSTIKSGIRGFIKFRFTMDSLIMLGTVIAFLTGILSLFIQVENFSGVSGMIMAIFITGKYIESVAKGKATKEIKKLLELGVKNATVIRDKKEIIIPLEEVQIGDIMVIKPGEKVPTDGIVVKGESYLDESMISGEPIPIMKMKGDVVIGATVNQDSILYVKATKIGKDTFLSNIIKLVEEAQGTKVPIQKLADKITTVFVPAILIIAVFTLIGWLIGTGFDWSISLGVAISVLVIACPCALGLAVPISLTVGSGMGAKRGVLIRKGEAIQTMKEVKIVCFDKTGTITKGKPEVSEIYLHETTKEEYLLKVTASLEKLSEHPLAKAILEKEKTKKYLDVKGFKVVRGKGVVGKIKGKEILIGNERLFLDKNISLNKIKDKISKMQAKGMSLMIVSEDKNLLGVIGIRDEIKEDSKEAISKLNEMGYQTVMITGDNTQTAEVIGREIGIKKIISNVLPEDKLKIVIKLQKQGFVAFVGDGINDAPALKQANVGIAVGSGTDIAIEAGDIVLANSDLMSVVKSINLSKKTFGKIKQNLFWAFFYNVAMVPLAIAGFINPVFAELAMALSSITVVTNANLLRRVKI